MVSENRQGQSRFDVLWIGLTFGYLSPVVSFLMVYSSSFSRLSFLHFISYTFVTGSIINVLISCLIPDLLVFSLFIWQNHYRLAKGIVIASASLTGAMVLLKLLLFFMFK